MGSAARGQSGGADHYCRWTTGIVQKSKNGGGADTVHRTGAVGQDEEKERRGVIHSGLVWDGTRRRCIIPGQSFRILVLVQVVRVRQVREGGRGTGEQEVQYFRIRVSNEGTV